MSAKNINYSIIICTFNRSLFINDTINSILKILENRKDFELLIINNNSTDGSAELLEVYDLNPRVRCFLELNQGLSHARNRGICEAQGDILVFLDDDIDIASNYFDVCDETFSNGDVKIVGGKVLPYKVSLPVWLPKKYYYLVSLFDLGDHSKPTKYIMGGNCAINRKVIDAVGFFNTELGRKGNILMGGEENEYQDRARLLGFGISYIPSLTIYHKIENKLNIEYVANYAFYCGNHTALFERFKLGIRYYYYLVRSAIVILFSFSFFLFKDNTKVGATLRINKCFALGYYSGLRKKKYIDTLLS